ncbi:MAG: SDR family NAD(P)-dependent oxidoreductase [Microscillaceae bacterium]|jgi:NADP-dependent 3-hydroxy acid dehydrogenase YdfG|nr:SDR family NAD(P)-dependent oxidoreductase [Microscillaceae bacterium]
MQYKLSQMYPQKRAFITGAASGLGKALAHELAQDGWTIGITDINYTKLLETATEIKNLGGKPLPYELDVADKNQYAEVAQDFLRQAQGIDVLFNNAGVGDGEEIGTYSLENWEWMIGINQMGVVYGSHFFVPTMKHQRSGHIINTGSAASFCAGARMATYNMTKAAVLSLTETMYVELADFNIRASCIMPYFFKTNIMQYARGSEEAQKMGKKMIEEAKMTAPEVAQEVLKKAAKGKLHILITPEARFLWAYKRFSPLGMLNYLRKMLKKNQTQAQAVKV